MKKTFVLLALFALVGGTPQLTNAHSTASSHLVGSDSYEQGYTDGQDYAADLAEEYGYQTSAYNNALSAQESRAAYNATHTDQPVYWRAYRSGLAQY